MRPSKVLKKVVATNAAPFLTRAIELVRRFLPATATDQEAMCGAIWLMGQCSVFLRNREQFTQSPFSLKIDEPFVERLADLITRLALGGLAQGWDYTPWKAPSFQGAHPTPSLAQLIERSSARVCEPEARDPGAQNLGLDATLNNMSRALLIFDPSGKLVILP